MRLQLRLICVVVSLVAVTGCKKEPDRFESAAAQAEKKAEEKAVARDNGTLPVEVKGAVLNAVFPTSGPAGTVVFTAEKEGYAEATVNDDSGNKVAMLAVGDLSQDPEAKTKFAAATDAINGSPVITVGKNQSAMLVNNKFQVKCSSTTLDPAARRGSPGQLRRAAGRRAARVGPGVGEVASAPVVEAHSPAVHNSAILFGNAHHF
jgi:hypothetical protein